MKNKKIIVDLIVLIHSIVVLIMLLSLPVVVLIPESRIYVLVFAILIVGSWVVTRGCPLRSWELNIRNKYNLGGIYQKMFITHYINKYFKKDFSDFAVRLFIYPYIFLVIILSFVGLIFN